MKPMGGGAAPSSGPSALGTGPAPQKSPEEQAAASLGELASAFLAAGNDPPAAAALLLEFLTQAGFRRSK